MVKCCLLVGSYDVCSFINSLNEQNNELYDILYIINN